MKNFDELLESALSDEASETIVWNGKTAVVLHRTSERAYLLVYDGGPMKEVSKLSNGMVKSTHGDNVRRRPPDIICVKIYGKWSVAEFLSRAEYFQKPYDPSRHAAVAGGSPREQYQMVKRHKGEVDVKIRILSTDETSTIKRGLDEMVNMAVIVDVGTLGDQPAEKMKQDQGYEYDPVTDKFVVTTGSVETQNKVRFLNRQREEKPRETSQFLRGSGGSGEEEEQELSRLPQEEGPDEMIQKVIEDLGKNLEQITREDMIAYKRDAKNAIERMVRINRISEVMNRKNWNYL